ncbi:hypothetical protein BCQ_PI018 (plasmid) [Bacillus cereus Q1]|uniref:Uncharacterized protein n=2 Tax=Bacillus cereus group TaxID=86661 RepID=B9J5V7_BACCQ|nr:hypothetical protein [Bacillus paranthracis]ACM15752.1 hypothetical protein BCQ_PI018 [Bacillus cereus Q1]
MYNFHKRFINVNEYFKTHPEEGVVAAIPTIAVPQDEILSIDIFDIIKFKSNCVEIVTCDRFNPTHLSLPEALKYTHEHLHSCTPQEGFATAIPIFDINESNNTLLKIKSEAVELIELSGPELGEFDNRIGNPLYVMNAANKYAISRKFAGAITTCVRNSNNNFTVFLIKDGYAEHDSLYGYQINHYTNFSYKFPENEKKRLIEAHELIISKIGNCNALELSTLLGLQQNYKLKLVNHSPFDSSLPSGCTGPDVVGCAIRNGSAIWIDLAKPYHNSVHKIAETLIHEMMHVTGYDHPNKNEPGYDTSIPILAEKCITDSLAGTTIRCSNSIRH